MREFEVAIDEAFIKGLRPERRMRRGTPVLTEALGFRIGKYSIEGSEYFIDPIPATVDMFYNWPFPQFIKGERYRFLIVRDHINMEDVVYSISADYTTATEIFTIDELTFGQGTLMEAADFGEYAFMTNGVIMIYWDTTITDWNEIVASATIPMMRTVCNFKGQMIGGCVLSDWHDCDETFVVWSKIGQADFTPGRRNEAGYRRDPFGGEIYHVRRLGSYVVIYSSKGITKMVPVSSPAATFGFEELHDVGLANRGAVAGNLKEHLFVDVDHYVWKLNEGGLTKLGYQEFVDDLSYGDILVHHDINKKDFYISAASAPLTTLPPTTLAPSTTAASTTLPTTSAPTTAAPTTLAPTTLATTTAPTTTATTAAPTTLATTPPPTTTAPTTAAPTTLAPTTLATSAAPTTLPTTSAPTTLAPTTLATSAPPPTTAPPTTAPPTTAEPTTLVPTTDPVLGETYFMRTDGTAANKAAAAGPGNIVGACMNVAVHNGETFSAGDVIRVCDDGGPFRDTLIPPSSGTFGKEITYEPETGDTPVFLTTEQLDFNAGTETAEADLYKAASTLDNVLVCYDESGRLKYHYWDRASYLDYSTDAAVKARLDAEGTNGWFYSGSDNNDCYVYDESGAPGNVEVPARANAIHVASGISHLIFDGLALKGGAGSDTLTDFTTEGAYKLASVRNAGNYIKFKNMTIQYAFKAAQHQTGSTYITWETSTINNCRFGLYFSGSGSMGSQNTNNIVFDRVSISEIGRVEDDYGDLECVGLHTVYNVLIKDCYFGANGHTDYPTSNPDRSDTRHGYQIASVLSGNITATRSYFYHGGAAAFKAGPADSPGDFTVTYCIFDSWGERDTHKTYCDSALAFDGLPTKYFGDIKLLNNLFLNPPSSVDNSTRTQAVIYIGFTTYDSIEIKNSIFYENTTLYDIYDNRKAAAAKSYTNNIIYKTSGNSCRDPWGIGGKTVFAHNELDGSGVNDWADMAHVSSINEVDPLLNSTVAGPTNSKHLQVGSPAIDTGVDTGEAVGLLSTSDWTSTPISVDIANQLDYDSYDIGPYIHVT